MLKIAVLVLAALAMVMADEKSIYDGKWNDVNTHEIIDNERLWKKYHDCFLNDNATGCPREALDLKRVIPEALETTCAKCSPAHIAKIRDTLSYFCQKHQHEGDAVLHKFDPEGKYRPTFEEKFGKIEYCT